MRLELSLAGLLTITLPLESYIVFCIYEKSLEKRSVKKKKKEKRKEML